MPDDAASKSISDAKEALAKAKRFTQNVTGNSTNAFAPKKPNPPKPPQARTPQEAPYSLKRELDAKAKNVDEYVNATK